MRLWSESITTRLSSSSLASALMVAFSVWLTGLVAFALRNQALAYVGKLDGYLLIFLFLPTMLMGIRYFHQSYLKGIDDFQPYVKLSEDEFSRLKKRLDRLLCESKIVIPIGLLGFAVFEDNFSPVRSAFLTGNYSVITWTSDWLWDNGLAIINWLLFVTAIWLVVTVWIGIFQISRQHLNFTPARFSNEFHGLAIFNLKITGFYFLGISIALLLNLYQTRNLFSLAFFYALLMPGVVGFLVPHYNIHRTLVKGKNDELARIDKEMTQYASRLHELALNKSEELHEYVKLSSRLIALGANERRIAEADDWPLDHGQISTFLILIVVPIILNLITNPLP